MRSLAVFLAALLLAGCAGPSKPAAVETSEALLAGGSIQGLVLDEAGLPIPDAQVGIMQAENLTSLSGSDGSFRLAGVPPGPRQLVVGKIGYQTAQRSVHVPDGEPLEVEVTLVAVAPPDEGITQVLNGKGFISCSFTTPAFGTTVTQPCGWDDNNEPLFPFQLDVARGLVAVVIELAWTPTTAQTAQELRIGLWKEPTCEARCNIKDGEVYGPYVNGPSPLKKVVGNASAPFREGLDRAQPTSVAAVALVRDPAPVAENPADLSLVWQQPVDFYVSVFYNRDAAPDYSVVPK